MIRQIQIDWDKFFSGLEKKPPNDLKVKVEAIVRDVSEKDYGLRSLIHAIVQSEVFQSK